MATARESAGGAQSDRDPAPRRPPPRVNQRGASSSFVGSSILILSSFAVSTLAMNFGKKIQESRKKSRTITYAQTEGSVGG